MRFALVLLGLVLLGAPALAEDVVVLTDGHRVTGEIVSEDADTVVIRVGDAEYPIARARIAKLERGEAEEKSEKDVIRLKDGGREYAGEIVAEDESTITMKVGDQTLGFDKSVIDWVRQDGKVRRFGPAPAPAPEAPRPAPTATRPERPEPSPAVKSWIDVCVKHLASEDPMVRRSASLALRALGGAARPALEKAAASDDESLAAAAKQLLESGRRGGRAGRGMGGRAGGGAGRLAEQLELTEEQRPKFDAIMEEAAGKRRELFQSMRNGDVDREQMTEKMREIHEATVAKLADVLTEEQMARYTDMMERMLRGGAGGRRGGGRRGGGEGGGR